MKSALRKGRYCNRISSVWISVTFCTTAAVAGCSGQKDGAVQETAPASKADAPSDNTAPSKKDSALASSPKVNRDLTWKKLDPFPLQIRLPVDANVNNLGVSRPAAAVLQPNGCRFTVKQPLEIEMDFETAKSGAETLGKLSGTFKGFSKAEQTRDGWVLAWEGVSSIDQKSEFRLEIRRTIGDRVVECVSSSEKKEKLACIEEACRTIKAL